MCLFLIQLPVCTDDDLPTSLVMMADAVKHICCVLVIAFPLLLGFRIRQLNTTTGSIREEAGAKSATCRVKAGKKFYLAGFNKAVCASQREALDQRAWSVLRVGSPPVRQRRSASLTAETKSRVNEAISSNTLPSHSKASIRIKADENKDGLKAQTLGFIIHSLTDQQWAQCA